MPISYHVDEKENLVRVLAEGSITEEELLSYQNQILEDTRLKAGFRLLFDASKGIPHQVSMECMHKMADLDKKIQEKNPLRKTAIVVPEDTAYALAKEFERLAQPNVIVFHSLDTAQTWLGCKPN